jgi:hypothetical protein
MFRSKLVLLLGFAVSLQTSPPDTDLFLATLSFSGAKALIGQPVNISKSPGYDNQPSFTPDGLAILFTSVRGGRKPAPSVGAAIGSDVFRYDLAAARVTRVTDTIESEYSPTVTPEGGHVSVIRVEADGTQRLWRFTLDGKQAELVLRDVKPVGYHAWVDRNTVAVFVLGQPATLQVADVATGHADVVAKDIGRSLQRIPGGGISYVQREAREGRAPALHVMEWNPAARTPAPVVPVVDGATEADLAWAPDSRLLMVHGGTLYGWRRGESAMSPAADLAALGLRGVSRMAVSPKGDWIVFVAQGG